MGSKVLVERLPGIKHYSGVDIAVNGTVKGVKKMWDYTEKDLGLADLMLYIGFFGTGYASGGGAAFFASVCDSGISGHKASVTVYGYSHSAVGGTLTHEVGHNLGMRHDHASQHGGSENPCDGKGFMSRHGHLNQWSECSIRDFIAQYKEHKNDWCLTGKYNF